MMIKFTGIFIFLLTAFVSKAQFSAGPDKTICSGTGTHLGIPTQTVPESWCITWSPAEHLDDPHSVLPHANPPNTTVYTVTVLTDDWQGIITDEVKITVGFGGIKFTPPFLNQGSEEPVHSELTINENNDPVTWSIEGEALGCNINSMTGEVTAGAAEYGKITIRATNQNHPACYAEKTLEINEGVRDVTARDGTHPGRIAKEGSDTLYLVGEGPYIITAVPNANGFSENAPLWYSDNTEFAVVPPNGQVVVEGTGSGDNQYHYTAGSEDAFFKPKVTVVHLQSDEYQIDMTPLVNSFATRINDLNERLKKSIKDRYPGIPSFTVDIQLAAFKYKRSRSEKYNDPGYDYKYTVEAGGSIALSGKVYHPFFTRVFDLSLIGIYAGTELYLEPYVEASATGAAIKDPSKEDPSWTFLANPIKINATGGIKGVFNVIGQAAGYQIEGGFTLNAEIGFDLTFYVENGELKFKVTVAPLQGITKVTIIRYIDPRKKFTFFNHTVDLIDKWTSPDWLLFDFGAQN